VKKRGFTKEMPWKYTEVMGKSMGILMGFWWDITQDQRNIGIFDHKTLQSSNVFGKSGEILEANGGWVRWENHL
jgi:hypothetical protein